jgi:hypothetical protein
MNKMGLMDNNYWQPDSYMGGSSTIEPSLSVGGYANIDPTPQYTSFNATTTDFTSYDPWNAGSYSMLTQSSSSSSVGDWMDEAAGWLQEHEAVTGMIGGAAGAVFDQMGKDDYYDFENKKLSMSEAQWKEGLKYEQIRAEAVQKQAEAAMHHAETARLKMENDERQRQRHNTGVKNFGTKYGRN